MDVVTVLCLSLFSATPGQSIDFASQIVPVFTKAGCNGGACHGAAAGRGGFHLSLLGSDPMADFESIVHQYEGRRINLVFPDRSLLLAKPTGQLDHGGDVVLDQEGEGAERLLSWIQNGASFGSKRTLTSFEVTPSREILDSLPAKVPLRAFANFDNGPVEDVTQWTRFTATDSSAVEIDVESSVATVRRRGQQVVIARFLDRVVPVQILVPLSEAFVDLSTQPRVNFVDEEILQTLAVLRLPVSPPCDDASFLRRVSLDLTGKLPSPTEVQDFLADAGPDKRANLVDRLLQSDAFSDYWTLRFARWLRLHRLANEQEGVRAYAAWLRQSIDTDMPMDELARQLLTATGDAHVVGPANFGRMVIDARGHAELAGQFFLGVRLGCANCHNHPLDRWTQDDYHGLAAVFARLDRGRNVQWLSRGAVTNPGTGEPALPRIPGSHFVDDSDNGPAAFAEWLTRSDNRYFARVMVNRLWQSLFGRGLVEPTDDLRDTNPASHPELLTRLADDFVEHGYSLRHTLRLLATSSTYSRSATPLAANAADDRFYSHAFRRPLAPEVLADAIADVTGVPDEFSGHAIGARAITVVDPLTPAPALDILGRCMRASGCEESATSNGSLPTQLHKLNGELLNQKISSPNGRLHTLIQQGADDERIVREFYLRGLGRPPSQSELQRWLELFANKTESDTEELSESDRRISKLEDFVWSLLCSRRFSENH